MSRVCGRCDDTIGDSEYTDGAGDGRLGGLPGRCRRLCHGVVAWGVGAAPGLRGAFEDERDWSLLYLDGPVVIFGTPALALGVWGPGGWCAAGPGPDGGGGRGARAGGRRLGVRGVAGVAYGSVHA